MSDPLAIRVSGILNTHVYQGTEISHVGAQFLFPWYILHKKEGALSGFFLAPLVGSTFNRISAAYETTVALEPGYTWYADSGFTLFLGFQAGATYFSATDETGGWRSHGGVKFSLGYRFSPGN